MSSVVAASSPGPTIAIPLPGGGDISKLLKSQGPVVTAVLLRADGTVNEISIDTTPQKQMVQHVLGGPFTFLGQYEDEGTVLMCRKPADDTSSSSSKLVKNTHTLQPPLDHAEVHGDVLIMKVAASDEDENEDEATIANAIAAKSNEEFFLHYSKDEYIQFAARTDIEAPKPVVSNEEEDADDMEDDDEEESDEVEEEGESDEEDDEEPGGFLELLMGQVMQRFQQDNGRMPDEQELAALQSVIAQKMGGMVQE